MSKTSRLRFSGGFTIVELLVVIAIIGTLVSILIPAVNGARSAAARTQNVNNLKQIATAIQSYESVNKTYPSMTRFPQGVPQTADNLDRTVSWAFEILPYMEQQNAYDVLDKTQPVSAIENYTAMTVAVPGYLNPQRTYRTRPDSGSFLGGYEWQNNQDYPLKPAVLDYAANGGLLMDQSGNQPLQLNRNPSSFNQDIYMTRFNSKFGGPFHFGVKVPAAAVKDGLSNTIAAGDRWVGPAVPGSNGIALNDLGGLAGQSFPTIVRFANPDERNIAGGLNTSFPADKTDPTIYKFGGVEGRDACFAYLDGHVTWVTYDVEQQIYMYMANNYRISNVPKGFQ